MKLRRVKSIKEWNENIVELRSRMILWAMGQANWKINLITKAIFVFLAILFWVLGFTFVAAIFGFILLISTLKETYYYIKNWWLNRK